MSPGPNDDRRFRRYQVEFGVIATFRSQWGASKVTAHRIPDGPDSAEGYPSVDRRPMVVLSSWRLGPTGDPTRPLPYGLESLFECGFDLQWNDRHLDAKVGSRWRRPIRFSERVVVPWHQTWTLRDELRSVGRDGGVVLSMFESEGHAYAIAKRLLRRSAVVQAPQIIIACWLTQILRDATPAKRRLYRWMYRRVDHIVVFSENQRAELGSLLDRPIDSISAVPFGVASADQPHHDHVNQVEPNDVVAVGRDKGRDWATLLRAVDGRPWRVRLITRPEQLADTDVPVPSNVTVTPTVSRDEYLDALRGARVVVVPTFDLAYPTGQTVLIEAMSLGKAVVVTDTPAMSGYVHNGIDSLTVPLAEPDALAAAIESLLVDEGLRKRLGEAGRQRARTEGLAPLMWQRISAICHRAAGS